MNETRSKISAIVSTLRNMAAFDSGLTSTDLRLLDQAVQYLELIEGDRKAGSTGDQHDN